MIVLEQEVFEWKEEYEIGVAEIDRAHKQLFSIVNRIINNFMDMDFERNKMTCMEAIKYLKSYTIKHFAEEEAYQRSINYGGYKVHKKIHDNMRDVVIPALEKEVTAKSYSKEALEHFVGACAGWLAAHVLVEDQAITGKTRSKWTATVADEDNREDYLDNIVKSCIISLFRMSAQTVSMNYQGYELTKPFCYTDTFVTPNGDTFFVVSAVEESVLQVIALKFFKESVFVMDGVMSSILSEMLKSFNMEIMMAFLNNSLSNTQSRIMSNADFYKLFETVYPDYTMLWRTEYGYIAFCIKKRPAQQ